MTDKPDQFDHKTAEVLPCICLPAYKDRGLSQPDCPRCNYGDDVAELLRDGDKEARAEELARIQAIADFYPEISGRSLMNAAREVLP